MGMGAGGDGYEGGGGEDSGSRRRLKSRFSDGYIKILRSNARKGLEGRKMIYDNSS